MVNKKQLKFLYCILCIALLGFMMPAEILALDNPDGGYIEVFPAPGTSDSVITDNYGTVNYAKTGGTISYNYNRINHLEGAVVGENKSTGIIDSFENGRVENNYGIINKVTNSASVGTNTLSGVIKENFNDIDKNMGTIEKQYSGTVIENYGNIGTVGVSATINKMYEGTITENNGNIDIYPAPEGIITLVKIGTNKKSVKIEADPNNKSSVVIDSNEADAEIFVCAGAECTVIDNAGTIRIEEGGVCNINGTDTGNVFGIPTKPEDGYDYRLILDNVNPSDITFVDFFKKEDGNIYVMNEGPDHNIILSYDTNKYFYPDAVNVNGVIGIKIENTEYSVLDVDNKTFTIHFHTMGEYVHSSGEKHKRKCAGTWMGSECAATFNEESCSKIAATCTSKAKCEKCGTEYGQMLSHSYNWVWEKGKHKQVCSQCGDILNTGNCSYGEWIIDSEAKVGVKGRKHRVCSVCQGVENATIPAKSDNGNKKPDNGQAGNEQDTNPIKENIAQGVKLRPDKGDIKKADSSDSKSEVEISSNSERSDKENEITDSADTNPDSGTAIDGSEVLVQESNEPENLEKKGEVASSNKSKTGIIVGIAVLVTGVAAGCFFTFSNKRSGR